MILENGFSRWMSATRYILIVFLLSLVACTRQRGYEESLAKADSLMNMAPDSSLFILDSLEQSAQDFSKSNLRRWQLLRMMAQNKCDTVFRSDSLQLVLTDYYDHYGTSNEKMWAYYLLGRAYYDMGEAPMAQKAFYEATEKADASSADCDYWNLCRIYFQLSDLYYQSMLPNQMLSTLNLAQTYAEKSGDTLSFITAIGRKTLAYELSDKPDSLILCAEETSKQFLVYGQKELSSQYLSLAIHPLILKGELGKASEYIALYEANSGYFDEKSNIQEGREIFYYSKGLYYLKTEKPDSAEWMFRKLLNLAKNINDTHAACMRLRNKYEVTGPIDSLAKYAILSEQFDDSLYLLNYRGDLQKNEQMYNYTRHLVASEKLAVKAENQKRKAERWKMSLIICLISAIGGFFILRNRKNKIVNRKVQEIELLQNTIAQMEEENSPKDQLDAFEESDVVKRFRQKARNNERAGVDELGELRTAAVKHLPVFMQTLSQTGYELQINETILCILIKAKFRPSEIAVLMNLSPQNITNLRARLNKKMFHTDKGARDFNDKIINLTSS